MKLLRRDILEKCGEKHPDVQDRLSTLQTDIEEADWQTSQDIRRDIPGARWLGKNSRVVFNVKGDRYRVVAKVELEKGAVRIRFAGTHAEYDKINADTV